MKVPGRSVIFRYQKNSGGDLIGMLTVPVQIAKLIPRGTPFEPVLTEEGILYRLVNDDYLPDGGEVPPWLKELNGGER